MKTTVIKDEILEKSNKNSETSEGDAYPSANFLSDVCYKDYIRLLETYNKLYEKLNIALAFVGIILTVMLTASDFSSIQISIGIMTYRSVLNTVKTVFFIGGFTLIIYSIIRLLMLLKGKEIPVFKSEDIRNSDALYNEPVEVASLWLIDRYTIISNKLRPIIDEKQIKFNNVLVIVAVGICLYAIAIMLQKGGF